MNVNLGPTLDSFVTEMVKSGLYQSQSEVLRESLRLLKEQKERKQSRLDDFRRALDIGDDAAAGGKLLDGPEVFAKIRRKSAAKKRMLSTR
jgi:antitoxin ParD1/3/4